MNTKNNIYKIIIIFLILISFLVIFLIFPLLEDIQASSSKILSSKAQSIFVDSQVRELSVFQKNYSDYETNLSKIDQFFVDTKNPIDFIEFLEKTGLDSNISVGINLLPQQKSQDSKIISPTFFQIYTKGEFTNILRFAEKIENGKYLIKINSMTVRTLVEEKDALGKVIAKNNKVDAGFLVEIINK